MRKDYGLAGLQEKDLAKNPFRQFEAWFQDAEITEPNAMTLATVGREPGADWMVESLAS